MPMRAMTARLLTGLAIAALAGAAAAQPPPPPPVSNWPGCGAPPDHSSPDPQLPFGCATEANLRAMIANPADLDHGAPTTPERGDSAVVAATRYRLGEVKPLASDSRGQQPLLVEGKIDTGK
jgi:hypothetical protein